MEVLRLYDPDRRPANWTGIIRPGQFAAFSKHVEGGGTCDAHGRPFASPDDITCLIFDGIAEAKRYCEEQVQLAPSVCFEVFDASGRANSPLLVVINPVHAHSLDIDPANMRRRTWIAIVLALGAVPLIWFDYRHDSGVLVLPTFLALNMLLAAGRLVQLNMAVRTAERQREERLAAQSERP